MFLVPGTTFLSTPCQTRWVSGMILMRFSYWVIFCALFIQVTKACFDFVAHLAKRAWTPQQYFIGNFKHQRKQTTTQHCIFFHFIKLPKFYLSLAWCDTKVTRIIKIVRFVDTGILSSSIKSNYTYAHSNIRRFRAFDWNVHNFLEPLHWPVCKQPVVMPKSFVTRIQIPQCVQSLKNR